MLSSGSNEPPSFFTMMLIASPPSSQRRRRNRRPTSGLLQAVTPLITLAVVMFWLIRTRAPAIMPTSPFQILLGSLYWAEARKPPVFVSLMMSYRAVGWTMRA